MARYWNERALDHFIEYRLLCLRSRLVDGLTELVLLLGLPTAQYVAAAPTPVPTVKRGLQILRHQFSTTACPAVTATGRVLFPTLTEYLPPGSEIGWLSCLEASCVPARSNT